MNDTAYKFDPEWLPSGAASSAVPVRLRMDRLGEVEFAEYPTVIEDFTSGSQRIARLTCGPRLTRDTGWPLGQVRNTIFCRNNLLWQRKWRTQLRMPQSAQRRTDQSQHEDAA